MAPVFRRAGVDPRPLAGVCALFLLLFCSFGYFYQAGGWNQNSRFALVRAITDRGSFRIDPFQRCTGDRAFENGHYYSDKAPGLAFAAVPVVEAGRFACSLVGVDPESYTGIAALSFVATVATNGLAVALAGLCLFWISRRLGASPGAATLVAVTFGLGTPMWAYATLFIGHALSAACLVFAFAAGVALRENGSVRRHVVLGAVVGAAAGWATITEFPAAIPAVILALFALAQARAHGPGRLGRVAAALGGAALACASIVMIYQQVCFGSPFHIAYRDEVGFAAMHTGLFGIGLPRASRLEMILFGQYRGLLPLAPVLALGPVGLAWLIARRPTRPAAITAASIVVYYFLLNAGYVYW